MAVERVARMMAWGELRGRDRGLRGSSGAWLAIWVLAVAYRQVRKWAAEDPIVVREVLKPGQQLVVTHFEKGQAPPLATSRRRRRSR